MKLVYKGGIFHRQHKYDNYIYTNYNNTSVFELKERFGFCKREFTSGPSLCKICRNFGTLGYHKDAAGETISFPICAYVYNTTIHYRISTNWFSGRKTFVVMSCLHFNPLFDIYHKF